MNWTEKQQQVINSRNRNLLVSAAAGSGKTAVLVERIIQIITNIDKPVNIDQLLIMTFTNAAAAEMRERIGQAIEARLLENPEDEHLQLQAVLVHHAQITTIDSFCLSLIREHFNQLEIDPSFRIGDEGELMLLKAEVMEQMLEDHYAENEEAFARFVDTYATGKSDSGIGDYIMQVYGFSQSNPWPSLWFSKCRKELEETSFSETDQDSWMQFLLHDIRLQAEELCSQLDGAIELCEEENGPLAYLDSIVEEQQQIRKLTEADGYEKANNLLSGVTFGRLKAIRSKEIDPDKKSAVTSCRDQVKKAVSKLKEAYAYGTPETISGDLAGTKETIKELLDLAEEFANRYGKEKHDKNLVDFNDLEHFALQILAVPAEDGTETYTEVADELCNRYVEIMVDEYQDSNAVQETLVKSLSTERFGHPDVFMVGDVKQSIYKFRLARPEIFMEKYDTYTWEESQNQKIELQQNFRSRKEVLASINDIFFRIMTKNLGNIQYQDSIALHPGAVFEESPQTITPTEMWLVDSGAAALAELDEDAEGYTTREMEAKLIASRIRQLTDDENGLKVWDKERKEYRTARCGDIVILLRSLTGWVETFLPVLQAEGIPAYAESRTGYFNTVEVETVLAFLSVIDNPMQDIPLTAVLRSPIVGLDDEELAVMMAEYRQNPDKGQDRGIYGACQQKLDKIKTGAETGSDRKLLSFQQLLEKLRYQATYLPIHELLEEILSVTGYRDCVAAMPAGETRKANLDMLIEKAAAYEKTSYKGLFHFIRYIEKLKKYDTDFGEASLAGGHEDTVRIMSIHKSKGLEFPVVILAGLGKMFNRQDIRNKILIDPELGIATDYLDLDLRVKTTTLKKNVLKRKMELDNLGEELRVLYVAMTRAKEKLIMTGVDKSLEKKLDKWKGIWLTEGHVPFPLLTAANSYLDWMLMALSSPLGSIMVNQVQVASLVGEEVRRQVEKQIFQKELLETDWTNPYDENYYQYLNQVLLWKYPYEADIHLHTKVSVSELKHQGEEIDRKESDVLEAADHLQKVTIQTAKGAARGTIYHRLLQLMDFKKAVSADGIREEIKRITDDGWMKAEDLKAVRFADIQKFFHSSLGMRMIEASKKEKLYKEKQFVMGIPARQMGVGETDELVLIQGIIDAYMEEPDGMIIVDYKTDHVAEGRILAERYHKQLEYYQKALEQITTKKVKEKVIYSLTLHEEIPLV